MVVAGVFGMRAGQRDEEVLCSRGNKLQGSYKKFLKSIWRAKKFPIKINSDAMSKLVAPKVTRNF